MLPYIICMGFVNINGIQVHTSNIGVGGTGSTGSYWAGGTWSAGTITTSGVPGITYTIQPQKTTYHILGKDVEVDGYKDYTVSMIIATINVLGKSYYDEIKKQRISLPKEIEEYLDREFLILERDRKIGSIINDRGNEV